MILSIHQVRQVGSGAVAARVQAVSTFREKLFFRTALVVGVCMLVVAMLGLMIKGGGS